MEEKYTKADVLLTVDIARLLEAKNRDLFVKIDNEVLKKNPQRI